MGKLNYVVVVLFLFILSCSSPNNEESYTSGIQNGNPETGGNDSGPDNSNWLIPKAEVKDGGPGKDGIPSIDSPVFIDANSEEAVAIGGNELIVGVVLGDEVRAYPHNILNWHEIVNDRFGDDLVTISFCPLTGTAFAWKSLSGQQLTTFGVSGLLYNANLILYDRKTNSNWSQLGLKCVNGPQINEIPELVKLVETTWSQWLALYPNTKVLSRDTGYSRSYGSYPYGPYRTNHDFFIFEASPSNSSLPNKERVYAIIDDTEPRVYQFEKFAGGKAIVEIYNGKDYLVVGNENLLYSFELDTNSRSLTFSYEQGQSGILFSDDEGNKWSAFGVAIEGPRTGDELILTNSVVSYWFAIAAFYPIPQLF